MPKPVIICVDDEKIVLDSLRKELGLSFRDMLTVELAESGKEALELLEDLIKDHYEVPIIISDWLMPDMKGDALLIDVYNKLPNTRTIMLTGQATTDGVGNAVNKAKLYRYIAKPWQSEDLDLTVTEAFKSYYKDKQIEIQQQKLKELNTSLELKVRDRTKELEEKNQELIKSKDEISSLLSKTLKGSIDVLIKLLSKAQPRIFEKGLRMRHYARRIIKKLEIQNGWEIEITCLLSQIGCFEVPEYILDKITTNQPLTQRERNYFLRHPKKGEAVLAKIPYLQNIAVAISKHLDDDTSGDPIADILRVTSDFDSRLVSGKTEDQAFKEMKKSIFHYKEKFLNALQLNEGEVIEEPEEEKAPKEEIQETKTIQLNELKAGDVIGKNICNKGGTVLIPAGKEVTEEALPKIHAVFEKYNLPNQLVIFNEEALTR